MMKKLILVTVGGLVLMTGLAIAAPPISNISELSLQES